MEGQSRSPGARGQTGPAGRATSIGGGAAGAISASAAAPASRTANAEAAPDGLAHPVLVVNRNFAPLRITQARQGFTLLYMGRARALDRHFEPHDFLQWEALSAFEDPALDAEAFDFIGTVRGRLRVPRLLQLGVVARAPYSPLRLSRRHVFLRDGFLCQYCGRRPTARDLSLDHVLPRSRGGPWSWDNLVACCRACNLKKGHETPDEAGMPLRARPTRPGWALALRLASPERRFEEWAPFLDGSGNDGPTERG